MAVSIGGLRAYLAWAMLPSNFPSSHAYGVALHCVGKIYMAPICVQFWGSNHGRYYEYSGYAGMRSMWMDVSAECSRK
jgi:hypothetical protein